MRTQHAKTTGKGLHQRKKEKQSHYRQWGTRRKKCNQGGGNEMAIKPQRTVWRAKYRYIYWKPTYIDIAVQ